MSGILGSLLSDLRGRDIHLSVEGDDLLVDAPAGALTDADRAALTSTKPNVLRFLELEQRLLAMTLEEFERDGCPIEIYLPWLERTLWWVPREEDLEGMVRAGIGRGRVYTARDLINLTRLAKTSTCATDITRIAKLKLAFGATILAVEDYSGTPSPPWAPAAAREACFNCKSTRLWCSIHDVVVCGRCHPPATPELVAEWIGEAP